MSTARHRNISRIREQLNRAGFPRLLMSLLVGLTGGAGFVASYLMLWAGLDTMWVRYLLAISIAYGVFLALMYLWVNHRLDSVTDVLDPSLLPGKRHRIPPDQSSAAKGVSSVAAALAARSRTLLRRRR